MNKLLVFLPAEIIRLLEVMQQICRAWDPHNFKHIKSSPKARQEKETAYVPKESKHLKTRPSKDRKG
eukprot:scaffold183203_cov48-Prasinocladus_malaysianus.AAC.1